MMSDKKYIEELKQYIDQLLLNNEMIDCIYVNPTDYNNYIMPLRKSASVNYDAPVHSWHTVFSSHPFSCR